MKDHHPTKCQRSQFWDAGEWECPCTCPRGWPRESRKMINKFEGEYRFLSNFWPAEVEFDGVTYPTVEHAYQAAKTTKISERKNIKGALTPEMAKKMGKAITLRADWETIKIGVMRDLINKKFDIPELKKLLLKTEDQDLIEGNWWNDTFWGVCKGKGENHLGKLLMEKREMLGHE